MILVIATTTTVPSGPSKANTLGKHANLFLTISALSVLYYY